MQRWDSVPNTEEKLMEEKLENLYQEMLKEIVFYMDEKKLTIHDLITKTSLDQNEVEKYFTLEKKNFSFYDEILRIIKEW